MTEQHDHTDHAHGPPHGRNLDYDHGTHHHAPAQPDDTSPAGDYELMIMAMRDLLIEKGILTADQIRRGLETLDSWQPSRGAEIAARAVPGPIPCSNAACWRTATKRWRISVSTWAVRSSRCWRTPTPCRTS